MWFALAKCINFLHGKEDIMKITIENGVTIINTGDAIGGLKNKNGYAGVHYLSKAGKYVAKIYIGKKPYTLGQYVNVNDAIAIRQEAERQKAAGSFLEWFETLSGTVKRRSPRK